MSKKHGNDNFYCFLEDGWDTSRPIEIWHNLGNGESEVMAHATDKYNAMQIVDALLIADNVDSDPAKKLTKKEMVFLQFVESQCSEPWCTMAYNALAWNDRNEYNNLKSKFPEIY